MTDTKLLDWLEKQNAKSRYTGRCVFRMSTTGRGWRLHETSLPDAVPSVRQAIRNAMRDEKGRRINFTEDHSDDGKILHAPNTKTSLSSFPPLRRDEKGGA